MMPIVVGVRFKRAGKMYYFAPDIWDLNIGDCVIVETAKGLEYGQVVSGPKEVSDTDIVAPLKKVIRIATDEDRQMMKENEIKTREAFEKCCQKIAEHDIHMKLIDAEYTFDRNKLIFYFTAEERVDFRDLVKELAGIFKTRIELRQIGVRDEAKMLGGLGPCGRPVCCNGFLGEFEPVSIKMAKEQDLALNPSKISGMCGRLMCCLKYEESFYEQQLRKLPKCNASVITPKGTGIVTEVNVILDKVKVKLERPDDSFELEVFDASDVKLVPGCGKTHCPRIASK
ncbi:PSP1 domain-containing protein [Mahella australiensis]|uniref:PSP1 domain protein n=1 Tax=Mahella australiensis (strain DSM 15567 / CIP 107919 / 50-1 BON) TaxID=697281 RepID=F3ZXS9_MAHA5|nr:PSP1 domain protein [Mahella australiensis 50-1 BON]